VQGLKIEALAKDQYILKYKKGVSEMFRERDQFNCEIDDDQDMAANLKDFNEMNVN
jgi:hypothetical protein